MRVDDLKDKNVVIWGKGCEGQAAAELLQRVDVAFQAIDEATDTQDHISAALDKADVIIKSPGVSLYHPLIQQALASGNHVTSLLNLWMAEPRQATVIGITGTKGKSTTAALLAHTLNALGKKTALVGNIGLPVTEAPVDAAYIVMEVSSYQAATFEGDCPIGVLTSLYPEHLDWHQTLETYYREKINLLKQSRIKVVNSESLETLRSYNLALDHTIVFNHPIGMHAHDGRFYDNDELIGCPTDPYLAKSINLSNACAVLAVLKKLGAGPSHALAAMKGFQGLPHRQQELGTKDGILYVDDSISTTPQSAIAAMESYKNSPISLIAGGHDRGIDYTPLIDYITAQNIDAVICMGPSGQRLFDLLWENDFQKAFYAKTMREAVALAEIETHENGVILLSPAAPSYDQFKNFEERGDCFAKESGFKV